MYGWCCCFMMPILLLTPTQDVNQHNTNNVVIVLSYLVFVFPFSSLCYCWCWWWLSLCQHPLSWWNLECSIPSHGSTSRLSNSQIPLWKNDLWNSTGWFEKIINPSRDPYLSAEPIHNSLWKLLTTLVGKAQITCEFRARPFQVGCTSIAAKGSRRSSLDA